IGSRDGVGKVDVVEQPDGNAAAGGGPGRGPHLVSRPAGQVQVIDGDVETALHRPDEVAQFSRDLLGRLRAVLKKRHLNRRGHWASLFFGAACSCGSGLSTFRWEDCCTMSVACWVSAVT